MTLPMSAVPADDLAMLVESADDLTMMRDARGLGVVDGLLQEGGPTILRCSWSLLMISR